MTTESFDQMPLPGDVALAIDANVAVIATLSRQIELLESVFKKKSPRECFYARKTAKTNNVSAIKALAHKRARSVTANGVSCRTS